MWKKTEKGIIIPVKITPKSSKNTIVGWENDVLKIRIAAVPEKGYANQELITFLAKELVLSKSQIHLISGESSRYKVICISGVSPEKIWFLNQT